MADSESFLHELLKKAQTVQYRKGEIVIRPGDTPTGISVITKGYVRFYSLSKEGQELTFFVFQPGDFFPVRWTLTGHPIHYYYETMTPVEIRRVSTEIFQTFLLEHADVLFELTGKVLLRLRRIFERMEYIIYGNAYERVASVLYVFAKEYGVKIGKGIKIAVPLTHKDIASVVGLTRETVSVEMGRLSEKGYVKVKDKRLVLYEAEKLKKEALLRVM
jgi:CRP-like cAMP-binding protein